MARRQDDEEPRLPFPTKPLVIDGVELEEYVIPDEKKAEVLQQLYIFTPVPGLDEERYDIHSGKKFLVRDFRVTRENGRNWLVSPYYEEAGGTVIDWMTADEFCDDEPFDESEFDEEDFEDGDDQPDRDVSRN